MSQKRASLSKRARFRIFERDGFTCQYCGKRPPEAVLQLDHIHPFSEGGTDIEENLITACFECNAGKSNRVLGAIIPRPDADAQFFCAQQEIAEARQYLEAKQERDELYGQLADAVMNDYTSLMRWAARPNRARILEWLISYGPHDLDYAIRAAAVNYAENPERYINAILKRRAEGKS